MNQLTVAILNYNGLGLLKQFLPGVVEHSSEQTVAVIDNGSTDGSLAWIEQHCPGVQLIQLKENRGYAGGYNEGIKFITTPYVVFLNNDVEVAPGWLDGPLAIFKNSPEVAAVQPKILNFSNRKLFDYAGAAGGFLDRLGYPFCRGRLFETIEEDKNQYDQQTPIVWGSGACLFLRKSEFEILGGFEDSFFAHMEEIDLCWRIWRSGKQVHFCPTSTVYHLGGGTLPAGNPRKVYLNFRNSLSLLFKNLRQDQLAARLPLRLILDGIAAIRFLIQGNSLSASKVFIAWFDFLTSLQKEKLKREKTSIWKFGTTELMERTDSVVLKYYLAGKRKFTD